MLQTATIISLDVWGNEDEGFEINDSFKTSHTITFDDTASEPNTGYAEQEKTDLNILQELLDNGFLNGWCSDYSVEWETETDIAITLSSNNKPILNLEIPR